MSKKDSSLAIKFSLIMGILVSLVFFSLIGVVSFRSYGEMKTSFETTTKTESEILAMAMGPHLFNFDKDTAGIIGEKFLSSPENLGLVVYGEDGKVFWEKKKNEFTDKALKSRNEVSHQGKQVGSLETFSDPQIWFQVFLQSLWIQIATNLAGLLLLILGLILGIRRVVLRPLRNLQGVLTDIAQGQGDLTKLIPVTSTDELGKLSKSFNEFTGKIRTLAQEIQSSLKTTLTIQDQLNRETQDTSASLNEISVNLGAMRKQIQSLDGQILSAGSAVEQISANIQSMGTLVDRQTQSVADSTSAVNEMVASINSVAAITETKRRATEKLLSVTKTGGDKLQQTTVAVNDIASNLGNISNLIKIINSIAAQTNLLAMNAAIEAAHAGDAGRGFSVVADEIRKLAEGSSANAKNIGAIIKTIVQKISEASTFAGETGQAFEVLAQEVQDVSSAFAEIAASTQELSTGGSQIILSMTQLQDISSTVRSGSSEMATGAQSMAGNMQTVRRISSEVLLGMQEIEAGTQGAARSVNSIHNLAQTLDGAADKLKKEISQFKTE